MESWKFSSVLNPVVYETGSIRNGCRFSKVVTMPGDFAGGPL